MSYAVLHAHDTYGSIGDSILYIKDYVERAKKLGIKSLALTNHGSLSTFVEFYDECKKNDIKPIIGCEFYYVEDCTVKNKEEKRNHLILLAKNNTGLKNLIRLHNIAAEEGFYYRPRIDFNLLKQYHDGLICLTACVAGHIPQLILKDKTEEAKKEILQFKKLFKSDFYLEIQPGNFEEQKKVDHALCMLSKTCNVPCVVTNDIHYLRKEDWQIHDYHVKDFRKQSLEDAMIYPDTIYYLMDQQELKDTLLRTLDVPDKEKIAEDALHATLEIADKVTVELPTDIFMPCYDNTINEADHLTRLCYQQLSKIENKLTDPFAYESRLEHELDTIHALGFDGYFLIIKDIIDFCDTHDIARGPGRGSAVGSLVSYLLNISKVDPIKYDLLFERFLSKDRKGWPDIDLDIIPEKRDQVYRHIIERYDMDRCCFVSTFNKRKARAAIKTATRILNKPVELGDTISKTIPYVIYEDEEKQVDPSIQEVIEKNPTVASLAQQHKDIFELAIRLQGYPSSMGIHPAGIVISPINIVDRYPLLRAKDKELHATSLDLKNVERLSGVKIDLLSLASLTIISAVEKKTKEHIDYEKPEFFNDDAVWNLIGSSNTTGLFQISSSTYKTRMPQLKPKSIPELAACLALVRGPCISSGADRKYIRILQGKEKPEPICKEYWKHTQSTHGIIIYQEQVLKICQEIGIGKEDSYYLLKACSKKKAEKIKEYETLFSSCAINKGIAPENYTRIWAEILNSAKYAFNVSHATAYAFLCYASAWLKVHHSHHYICELLNKIYLKPDVVLIQNVVRECHNLHLSFLSLDVNKSDWEFKLESSNAIRIGFTALKSFGHKAFEAMQNTGKPFLCLEDFLARVPGRQCNKKCVSLLILADAFYDVEKKPSIALLEEYVTKIRNDKFENMIKVGKDIVYPNDDPMIVQEQLFGVCFPGKEEAA